LKDENKIELAILGGVIAVINAMRSYPKNPNVQETGCSALWNIAANGVRGRKIVSNLTLFFPLSSEQNSDCSGCRNRMYYLSNGDASLSHWDTRKRNWSTQKSCSQ
jgi:hypothetical protein